MRSDSIPRKWIAIVAIALLAGVSIGFFSRDIAPASNPAALPKQAQNPATLEKFRVSGNNPAYDGYFLVVEASKDRGIWAANGLDPEFVLGTSQQGFKSGAVTAADFKDFLASEIKLGFVTPSEVLLARSNGIPVKIVAGYAGDNTVTRVYVKSDGPIKTVKDLDGKRLGVVSTAHNTYRQAMYLASKFAIKPEIVSVGNVTQQVVAVKVGRVDAFVGVSTALIRLVDSGELRVIAQFSDFQPKPFLILAVWATDDVVEQKPDLVRRFVTATMETVRYLKDNPSYAAELYAKKTNSPRDLAYRIVTQWDWAPNGRGSGSDLVASVTNDWQYQKDSGAIPATMNINIEDAVDVRFLP